MIIKRTAAQNIGYLINSGEIFQFCNEQQKYKLFMCYL